MVRRTHPSTGGSHAARLTARPALPTRWGAAGTVAVETGGRPAILEVPATYRADQPAPLAVMFHGAGGVARHGADLLAALAPESALLVLAPQSETTTWDVIEAEYGPDVRGLDEALAAVFGAYAVDPARVVVGGFSDGASYALSVGLANGDLFTHVVAFSPGFVASPARIGRPRVFVSHGIRDRVLPIDACSRRIVPELRRSGLVVDYLEFDGAHAVPEAVRRHALDWFLRS